MASTDPHAGGITCREAQGLIRPYVDGTIRDRSLRHLIGHVRSCRSCYSELETNFMVDRTIRLLDEEGEQSFDLVPLLKEDMEKRERAANRRGVMSTVHTLILLFTILLIALLLLDLTGIFHITHMF